MYCVTTVARLTRDEMTESFFSGSILSEHEGDIIVMVRPSTRSNSNASSSCWIGDLGGGNALRMYYEDEGTLWCFCKDAEPDSPSKRNYDKLEAGVVVRDKQCARHSSRQYYMLCKMGEDANQKRERSRNSNQSARAKRMRGDGSSSRRPMLISDDEDEPSQTCSSSNMGLVTRARGRHFTDLDSEALIQKCETLSRVFERIGKATQAYPEFKDLLAEMLTQTIETLFEK